MADAEAVRPQYTPRAVFSANHNWPQIVELARNSPLGDAVSFVHAFTAGFPFVTWAEIDGREAFFAALMHQRQQLTGYRGYHDRAQPDHDALWTALWTKIEQTPVLAVANVSLNEVQSTITVSDPIMAARKRFGTKEIETRADRGALLITMPAAGYALIKLDLSQEPKENRP